MDRIDSFFQAIKDLKRRGPSAKYVAPFMDIFYEYGLKCNGHIVELGVEYVNSAWAWLKVKPKKITLCDIYLNLARHRLETYKELCKENGVELVLENKSSLDITIKDVDLLFIDSNHSYHHVSKELELHSEAVNKFILLHDHIKFPDVKKATDDFLKMNNKWKVHKTLDEWPGLNILERVK